MPATESMLPTGEPGGGSAPSWAHKNKKRNEKRGGGAGRGGRGRGCVLSSIFDRSTK